MLQKKDLILGNVMLSFALTLQKLSWHIFSREVVQGNLDLITF